MTYLSQGLYTEIRIRNPQTQEMCWGYNPEALDQEEHIADAGRFRISWALT